MIFGGFLGFPHVLSRFQLRPYSYTVMFFVTGVLVSILFLHIYGLPSHKGILFASVLFIAGITTTLYIGHPVSLISIFIVVSSAHILLAAGSEITKENHRFDWIYISLLQLIASLLLFGYVSAYHFPYMPDLIGDTVAGHASEILILFHLLLPLTVIINLYSDLDNLENNKEFDRSRRSFLGLSTLGLIPIGLLTRVIDLPNNGQRDDELKLMTYNIHLYYDDTSSGQYNLVGVRNLINKHGIDVVALQETEGARITTGNIDGIQWLSEELDYDSVYGAPTALQPEGVAILSRWPIISHEVEILPGEDTVPTLAVKATIDAPDGELEVISTHLIGSNREIQPPAINKLVEEKDRIAVLGDFNLRPDDEEYSVLSRELQDTWKIARDKEWRSVIEKPSRRVDYIWLKGNWRVKRTLAVGDREISDHPAIISSVERT